MVHYCTVAQFTMSQVRRGFYGFFAAFAVVGFGVLAAHVRPPAEPLPAGSPFPELDLQDWETGAAVTIGPTSVPTLLILVSFDCPYCSDQLSDLTARYHELPPARIIMVTGEPEPPADYTRRWEALSSDSVLWLRAEGPELMRQLGTRATPSTFIYDDSGHLVKSFQGLTGVETITRELVSTAIVPAPQQSPY